MAILLLVGLAGMALGSSANEQVPLDVSPKKLLAVEVTMGGHNVRLLVDSGADRTVLGAEAFERIVGRDLTESERAEGVESERRFDVRSGSVLLGGSKVVGVDLPVLKQPLDGLNVEGLLGRDLLSQRCWLIDYTLGRCDVLKAETSPEEAKKRLSRYGKAEVSARDADGEVDHYTVHVQTDRWRGRMMFDTGATTLTFSSSLVNRLTSSEISSVELHRAEKVETRRVLATMPFKVGGIPLLFPVGAEDLTDEMDGTAAAGPLALKALALFPDRSVALWADTGVDHQRTQAMLRLTGLPLVVRGGRVFTSPQVTIPDGPAGEYEVVTIEGTKAADLIPMLTQEEILPFAELLRIATKTLHTCTLEVKNADGVRKVNLVTQVR